MGCKSWKSSLPFTLTFLVSIFATGIVSSFYSISNITEAVVKGPIIFVKKSAPKWTDEARVNKVEGVVSLKVKFDKLGKAKNIEVLKGLPFGLTESAINSAKETEIEPYSFLSETCEVSTTINYNFKPQN